MFFAYSHFNNFIGAHGHIPAIFKFLDLMLSALSQIPQHSKTYLQSLETKPENHFILWQSQGTLFELKYKRPTFSNFLGLKLIQKICPTIEQKLVNAVRVRSLRMLAMPLK